MAVNKLNNSLNSAKYRQYIDSIHESPGCSLSQLAKSINVSYVTVKHWVAKVEQEGILFCIRDGRIVRLYLREDYCCVYLRLAPYTENPRRRAIINFLSQHSGQSPSVNHVAESLAENFGFVKRTLEGLERFEVVKLEKCGIQFRVQISEALKIGFRKVNCVK